MKYKEIGIVFGTLLVLSLMGLSYSVGFHSASEIMPGSFPDGNFTFNGTVTANTIVGAGSGFSDMSVYTSSGSFTVPANVYRLKVEVWGAGAGGGRSSLGSGGSGGGGGGYCLGFINTTPGTVHTITIGTGGAGATVTYGTSGGNSSFDDIINATGGNPGSNGGTYGHGGDCTAGGKLSFEGGAGNTASLSYDSMTEGGNGGDSPRGGAGGEASRGSLGRNGEVPGGAGGGGGGSSNGGAGANGMIVVWY